MTQWEHEQIAKAEERAQIALRAVPTMLEKGFSLEEACKTLGISIEEYDKAEDLIEAVNNM